jgi:sigma-B regulation protein RsbU (phosphoserine phosphatase)
VALAAATVLYSVLWMYYIRREPQALLGIEYDEPAATAAARITRVTGGSGAERAGVRVGDLLLAVNGRPLATTVPLVEAVGGGRPGDIVHLTIDRPGEPAPVILPVILGAPPAPPEGVPLPRTIATEVVGSFPVVFLAVGLVVLFSRLEDRNAWLLMLLFCGLIGVAPILDAEGLIHPALRGFALAYKVIFHGLIGAFFYYLCAVFPASSRIDRGMPWLKFVLLGAAAAVAVPLGIAAFVTGSSRPIIQTLHWVGSRTTHAVGLAYYFGSSALALASLVLNGLYAPSPQARRKTRVIVWGTVAAILPFVLLEAAAVYSGKDIYQFPFWVWAPCVLAVMLLPLSFAYAVVKHRVLEIPLLIRRSARYLLVQRGFTVLLVLASAALTLLLAGRITSLLQARLDLGAWPGIALGAGLGILMVWTGTRVRHRVTERIDRAFFRSAYDARQILQELAEKTFMVTSRDDLGTQLANHIRHALHPRSLVIYLEGRDGLLASIQGIAPPGAERIPASHPALAEIARLRRPCEVRPPEPGGPADSPISTPLPGAECLVPLPGRDGRLVGVIALGERLSEEPYSREDKQLLASVAGQAALALENIGLAEQIAERVETERRAAVELEVAREVQFRLLPGSIPLLRTLDYAGTCRQARAVGGDFYDFLDLGGGDVGLILADIAGKGIAGALLMASLQANLRSQSSLARHDLRELLRRINRLLRESIAANRFATLFFGCYEDGARRLRYVNCGHNPPIVLRADDHVERLAATATILGSFESWDCSLAEVVLAPGDTLLLYSDGVVEAVDSRGEEFGEARLLAELRRHRGLKADAMVASMIRAVQEHSPREQGDDMTLAAGRCR